MRLGLCADSYEPMIQADVIITKILYAVRYRQCVLNRLNMVNRFSPDIIP